MRCYSSTGTISMSHRTQIVKKKKNMVRIPSLTIPGLLQLQRKVSIARFIASISQCIHHLRIVGGILSSPSGESSWSFSDIVGSAGRSSNDSLVLGPKQSFNPRNNNKKQTYGNICGVLKGAGNVWTAFPSSHSHPSTKHYILAHIPQREHTKPQRLFPFPLTQHRSQHRVRTTSIPHRPRFVPDLQHNSQRRLHEMDKGLRLWRCVYEFNGTMWMG
jgi:hypothetical protein